MDSLVAHGIRMLEIADGENDFFRNDAKRQADIARAVYATILRVQILERYVRKQADTPQTEQTPYDNCKECKWWFGYCHLGECEYTPQTEQTDCDGNCWMKREYGEWLCEKCQKEPQSAQTDCAWK